MSSCIYLVLGTVANLNLYVSLVELNLQKMHCSTRTRIITILLCDVVLWYPYHLRSCGKVELKKPRFPEMYVEAFGSGKGDTTDLINILVTSFTSGMC